MNDLRNLILWQNTETKLPKLHYALQFFDSQLCILHRQCSEPYKSSRVFLDYLVQLVVQKHTSAPKWKLLHWIERGLKKQNAQVCAILCLCPIREHHGNSAQNLNIDFQIVRVLDAGPSTVTIFLNFTEKFVSLVNHSITQKCLVSCENKTKMRKRVTEDLVHLGFAAIVMNQMKKITIAIPSHTSSEQLQRKHSECVEKT